MFCFISSVRAPQRSDNWPRVCTLFERMAVSVFNQSNPDFRLIVVCHLPPTLTRSFDSRLEFISTDMPLPKRTFDSMTGQDKVSKLLIAMKRVRELNASHVMPVDADDLISRNIVSHALQYPDADGWFVQRGWRYQYGRLWLEELDDFNNVCGTCNVLSRRWFAYPGQPELEKQIDTNLIADGHGGVVEAFLLRGAKLWPFPFRAAVYTVLNGENTTKFLRSEGSVVRRGRIRRAASRVKSGIIALMRRRPCGARIRREFALETSIP